MLKMIRNRIVGMMNRLRICRSLMPRTPARERGSRSVAITTKRLQNRRPGLEKTDRGQAAPAPSSRRVLLVALVLLERRVPVAGERRSSVSLAVPLPPTTYG